MSSALKILGILLATVVAVAVFAAIIFMLVFDANDYKDDISEGVRKATGRELVIEGDLQLSLFPWLAIELGSTQLGNAPGFDDTPFASFESARLSVRVMPLLLRREVVIGTAALDSLRVNLQVRKDGTEPTLGPDAKSQLSVVYDGGKPVRVSSIVLSTQHLDETMTSADVRAVVEPHIRDVLPEGWLSDETV
mgnify:CR=1 FL=1